MRHVGRRRRRRPSACGRWSRASPASASPRPTAPPSACSPTSRPGCGSTTAPEFLCALLNEQPMGFYAPDSLVHEAENRGDRRARAGRERLRRCSARSQDGGVRLGPRLRQGRRRAPRCASSWPSASAAGPSAASASSPPAPGCRRVTLEQLAWSGACDGLLRARQRWAQTALGAVAARAGRAGARARGRAGARRPSSRCRSSCPRRRALRPLGRWQRLIADYSTSGVTVGDHAMAILRGRLTVRRCSPPAPSSRGCPAAARWRWRGW